MTASLGRFFDFKKTRTKKKGKMTMVMEYRATGSRIAIDLGEISRQCHIDHAAALSVLVHRGFTEISIDFITEARSCIGNSQYERGAQFSLAPHIVDCRSFIKFLYGMRGIWLSRNFLRWIDLGIEIERKELSKGDLVFTTGLKNYPIKGFSVGHVAIVTGENTVIHATSGKGVTEISQESFFRERSFQCARRLIPLKDDLVTFLIPPHEEIETSDEITWIVDDAMQQGS